MLFGLVPALGPDAAQPCARSSSSGERGSSRGSRVDLSRASSPAKSRWPARCSSARGLLVRTVTPDDGRADWRRQRPRRVTASVQLRARPVHRHWPSGGTKYARILVDLDQPPAAARRRGRRRDEFASARARLAHAVCDRRRGRRCAPKTLPQAQVTVVTEGYFETIGARLVDGPLLHQPRRRRRSPGALVVVNETFAKQFFADEPGASDNTCITTCARRIGPLGQNLLAIAAAHPRRARRLRPQDAVPARPHRRDRRRLRRQFATRSSASSPTSSNAPLGPGRSKRAMYFSARQFPFRAMFITVDAQDSATAVDRDSSRRCSQVVPTRAAVRSCSTWDQRSARGPHGRAAPADERFSIFFSALAAVLAALGVYGLFSWSVALRRRELAIRLTLGARPTGIGALGPAPGGDPRSSSQPRRRLGRSCSLPTRTLARVLFEVTPADVTSAATAIGALVVASLLACLPPLLRAMRVDPVEGLRSE